MSRDNELHRIPPVVLPHQSPPPQQMPLPPRRSPEWDMGSMADNVKYIRWAAKVLKVIMVINLILEVVLFLATLLGSALATSQSTVGASVGFTLSITGIISVIIKAFITYTAARGLELLADVAYYLLVTWQRQNQK